MQLGDAKKNVPLAIVAVLAVGFAITRVMPGPAQPQTAPRQDPEKASTTSSMPTVSTTNVDPLQVDPFSSIKLVRMPAKAGDEPHQTSISETVSPVHPGGISGLELGNQGVLPPAGWEGGPGKKTAEETSVNREETKKKLVLVLKGVIQAQAYLTVDGAEAKGFFVGDAVADGVRLTRIDDDSVTVMKDHKSVTLHMRTEVSL